MAPRFNGASRPSDGAFCAVQPPHRIARTTASVCLWVSIFQTALTFSAQDPATKAPETAPTVEALVDLYFHTDDAKERAKLASAIENRATDSSVLVTAAVRSAKLWPPLPGGDVLVVRTPTAGPVKVLYHGFINPDPTPSHGLVLCMPAENQTADIHLTRNRAIEVLGGSLHGDCALAVLDTPIGGSFHQPSSAPNDLRFILRELRRRIHINTDQVYLYGCGRGGESAWIAAMFHPDVFAAAVVVSAYPRVPYPEQLYPILLGNLRNLPVLVIRAKAADDSLVPGLASMAAHHRAIVELSARIPAPVRAVESPFVETQHGNIPQCDLIAAELRANRDAVRPPPGRAVSHWFRYLGQGEVGWLRATQLSDDEWDDDQLSIVTGPATDREAFIADVLKDKLFYLGGRIEDQTIHIETKRCAEIELRLFERMVDFQSPITVIVNGRKRHEGLIRPSIPTLLETAYEDWEFQRVVFAKLTFSIRADSTGE